MKMNRIFLLSVFFIVFRILSFAQDGKLIQHSALNDKIITPDSTTAFFVSDSNIVFPSEVIYGKSWDTLNIRYANTSTSGNKPCSLYVNNNYAGQFSFAATNSVWANEKQLINLQKGNNIIRLVLG